MLRIAVALFSVWPLTASANLMTFDELPGFAAGLTSWSEDGITATSSGRLATFGTPGEAHLDHPDTLTSYASRIDFTTGSLFTVDNLSIHAIASFFCAFPCDETFDDPFPYISINGYVGDVLVESLLLWLPASPAPQLVTPSFAPIDLLRVSVFGDRLGAPDVDDGICINSTGCGHFSIDSVRLTGVPEPETILLFVSGLLTLLLRRRRVS